MKFARLIGSKPPKRDYRTLSQWQGTAIRAAIGDLKCGLVQRALVTLEAAENMYDSADIEERPFG